MIILIRTILCNTIQFKIKLVWYIYKLIQGNMIQFVRLILRACESKEVITQGNKCITLSSVYLQSSEFTRKIKDTIFLCTQLS